MEKKTIIAIILISICSNFPVWGQGNYGFELIGRAVPGESEAVFADGNVCYLGTGNTLQVLNISNPDSPVVQGQISLPGIVQDVCIRENLACIADDNGGLIIADVSIPQQITIISQFLFSDDAFGIYVDGDYAYIAAVNAGFLVVDITNPDLPVLRSSFTVDRGALNVDVQNEIACVACGYGGLYILDVSNPDSAVQLGLIDEQYTWAYDVKMDSNHVYMAYALDPEGGGLKVINISNPRAPYIEGNFVSGNSLRRMDYRDGYVFAACETGGMLIIDATIPGNPHPIGGWAHGYGENIAYDNNKIFLSCGEEGFRIFNASDLRFPNLICTYPTFSACQDVAIAGGYAYVAEQPSGLKAINISNPATPSVTYSHNFYYENGRYGGISSKISISNNMLYIADITNLAGGEHDFRIYGLNNPAQPESLGIYNDLNSSIRSHAVRNDVAYLSNGSKLKILDVRYPDNIELINTLIGGWDSAADMDLVANYMYLATRETGLRILNIANEISPVVIGEFDTEGEAFAARYHGGLVYVADYDRGLRIINVDDPENPYEIAHFIGSYEDCRDVGFIDDENHSYAVVGFDDQIVALDITDPLNPGEVGYFETGDPRRLITRGDTVYVADRDYGLYILKLDAQVGISENESNMQPPDIRLARNYPNPFNSSTIIEFILPGKEWASVDIYDILGRKIANPFHGETQAGINSVTWNGKDFSGQTVASGIYFCRIEAAGKSATTRLTFVK